MRRRILVVGLAVMMVALGFAWAQQGDQAGAKVQAAEKLQVRRGGSGGPVLVAPPCGVELHNFPRVINMSWQAVPQATGYQVEIDCFHCRQNGKWDSEVGPPTFVPGVSGTSASYTFSGDNKGRWRVRSTQTASTATTSAIQAGPWSKWCTFSFKTGGQLGDPPIGKPDITSKKGITIGGAIGGVGGKFVPWGGNVVLKEGDAIHGSPNSECAFNLSYDMVNLNAVPTGAPFINKLKMDASVVSIQSALSLAASEVKVINTQAYLKPGKHTLGLWLDEAGNVAESNEGNNVFRIVYTLDAKCYTP